MVPASDADATSTASEALSFAPTAENYFGVLSSSGFLHAALISALITITSTLAVMVIATLGGYAFAYFGSYNPVWWLSVFFGVMSALINLPIVVKPAGRFAAASA